MSWMAPIIAGADRSGESPERILHQMAIQSAMARAGFVANPTDGIEPAAKGTRPPADHAVGLFLRCGNDRALVDEWCEAAVAGGYRAPASVLPVILERSSRVNRPDRRLLDEEGRWLALLHPRWKDLVGGATVSIDEWDEASHAQRLQLLPSLPFDQAIGLVRRSWSQEPAKHRQDIAAVLAQAPEGHEDFFTSLLSDRSLPVRRQATIALSRLPASPASEELLAFAQEFVTWDPFSARLPEGTDVRLERYGIQTIKGPLTVKDRAAFLRDLVTLVHPERWGEIEVILPKLTPDAPCWAVLQGLADACEIFQPKEWAARAYRAVHRWGGLKGPFDLRSYLLTILQSTFPLADRERIAREGANRQSLAKFLESIGGIVHRADRPSLEYSDFLMSTFYHFRQKPPDPWLVPHLKDFAYQLHPSVTVPVLWPEPWAEVHGHWTHILDIRREIAHALQWNPHP